LFWLVCARQSERTHYALLVNAYPQNASGSGNCIHKLFEADVYRAIDCEFGLLGNASACVDSGLMGREKQSHVGFALVEAILQQVHDFVFVEKAQTNPRVL
jgi:hypothetical protein